MRGLLLILLAAVVGCQNEVAVQPTPEVQVQERAFLDFPAYVQGSDPEWEQIHGSVGMNAGEFCRAFEAGGNIRLTEDDRRRVADLVIPRLMEYCRVHADRSDPVDVGRKSADFAITHHLAMSATVLGVSPNVEAIAAAVRARR